MGQQNAMGIVCIVAYIEPEREALLLRGTAQRVGQSRRRDGLPHIPRILRQSWQRSRRVQDAPHTSEWNVMTAQDLRSDRLILIQVYGNIAMINLLLLLPAAPRHHAAW